MTETRTLLREHESELVVASATPAADGVVELRLVADAGSALPPWTPGAHVDLVLGDLVRQYSLCGDPTDQGSFTVAVLREKESRGGSAFVHEQLT
jgi:ferredoxin-NADP reductase